jgi:sugar phosphate permease
MLLEPSEQKQQNEFKVGGRYAKYVLVVLVIVYIFNFIDRQILSILAEDIKADLGISDAEIGFLYGTAFAVFYAVFGLPLGRLADTWGQEKSHFHRTAVLERNDSAFRNCAQFSNVSDLSNRRGYW